MKDYYKEQTVNPKHCTIKFEPGIGGRRTATGWPIMVIVERGPNTITVVDESDVEWSTDILCQIKPDAILYTFSHDVWLANGFYHYD